MNEMVEKFWILLNEKENDPETTKILNVIATRIDTRRIWIEFLSGAMMAMYHQGHGVWPSYDQARSCTKEVLERWFSSRKPT